MFHIIFVTDKWWLIRQQIQVSVSFPGHQIVSSAQDTSLDETRRVLMTLQRKCNLVKVRRQHSFSQHNRF